MAHPQIQDATARLAAAKAAYGQAVQSIDRQYLKQLVGTGDAAVLADVNALRAAFLDVADVATVEAATAYEQPSETGVHATAYEQPSTTGVHGVDADDRDDARDKGSDEGRDEGTE